MAIAFLNNITFSGGAQAEKLRVENLGSDPASGNEGQLYFNTATDKVKVYANGAWTDLDGANDFLTGLSFNTGDGILTATIPNQSNVTVDLDGRYALSSSIPGTIVESVTAGTYLNNSGTAADVILNHDTTSRSDTTSTSSPGFGGTVDLVNTITTNSTGHVTAVDIQTVTFPTIPSNIVETITTTDGTYINLTPNTQTDGNVTVTADLSAVDGTSSTATRFLSKDNTWDVPSYTTNTDETYTLPVAAGGTNSAVLNLTAGGTGSGIKSSVTINGDSNTVKVTESTGNNGSITLDLQDDVTITNDLTVGGELTVSGTGQSSFGGQVTVPTTPSAATDAASKSYVDSLVAGGLTFKDGFNAATGAIDGGGNLTTGASRVALEIGDYYVVTTAGSFYGSVSLDVGDSVIAKEDAAQGTSDINDWVIVQGDEGVTTFSNSNGGTYVAYGSTNSGAIGPVDIGDVDLTAVDGTSDTATRFLSKDNTWDVPSYTTNSDAKYALTAAAKSGSNVPLTLTGSDGGATTTVNLTEGANITLTRNSSGQITIASTDTGALGDRVALTGGVQAGGLTTFTYAVTNSFAGASAIDVKCEVISAAGETVYASVTRSGANLIVEFTGSISNSAYEVLLTYVG